MAKGLQQAGLILMIPTMMAAGPIAGYFVGYAIDQWLNTKPWFASVMAFLGLLAALKETIRIIKIFSKTSNGP